MKPLKSKRHLSLLNEYQEWLNTLGYSSAKIYEYPRGIRDVFYWMEKNQIRKVNQLNKETVNGFIEEFMKGKKSSTINSQITSLKSFSVFMKRNYNQSIAVSHLKGQDLNDQSRRILTLNEVKKLFEVSDQSRYGLRDKAILALAYGAGLRRNEISNLQVKDLDLSRGFVDVRFGKGYKERLVPLSDQMKEYLKEYLYKGRPLFIGKSKYNRSLFLSYRGEALGDGSFEDRLHCLLNRAKINRKGIGLHTLRHSVATHLMNNGMSLEDIGDFLGHQCLDSTQIYTHITNEA